MFKKGVDLTL